MCVCENVVWSMVGVVLARHGVHEHGACRVVHFIINTAVLSFVYTHRSNTLLVPIQTAFSFLHLRRCDRSLISPDPKKGASIGGSEKTANELRPCIRACFFPEKLREAFLGHIQSNIQERKKEERS